MANETKPGEGSGEGSEIPKGADLGASEVQARMDEEQDQGFHGTKVDPTPNENYTVAGVTSGAPTPETDADAAREARAATGIGRAPLEAAATPDSGTTSTRKS